jgi:outer membrane protein assembly factor BamB
MTTHEPLLTYTIASTRRIVYVVLGWLAVSFVYCFGGNFSAVGAQQSNRPESNRPESNVSESNLPAPIKVESPATQSDWPHLRGPRYDGHAAEADWAEAWPTAGPPMLWNREIGRGYSGIIAVGNRVYTQTQTLTEQKVVALDADTGLMIWEYCYGWPYEPGGMYPGPRATPTWANGRIYFLAPDGLLGCLNAANGRLLWSIPLDQKFEGRGVDFGYSSSPLIENGKVILPVGGKNSAVVALDAETGATAWTSGDTPASYCSILPITFQGSRQLVAFLRNELAGFDLQTGRVLWRESLSHGYAEHAAFPLYDEPYLRIMQPFHGGSDLSRLENAPHEDQTSQDAACHLQLVRHDKKMSNDVASSVLVDGCVYGFDVRGSQTCRHRPTPGEFRCMDFQSGEIRWSSDCPGHASLAVGGGMLFMLNDLGEALLVRANPDRYEELGRCEVFPGEICWTAPCLHHGRLYLRSPMRAACLYVGKPEKMPPPLRALATPLPKVGKIQRMDWSWLLGAEREYPFELPDLHELTHWYVFSLAVIVLAGGLAVGFSTGCNHCRLLGFTTSKNSGPISPKTFFLPCLLLLGIVATPLGNRFSSVFLFTWPVSLFAAHQIALTSVLWSRQPQRSKNARWLGRLGIVFFIFACWAYYRGTWHLSLAPAWYFLPTFLAAWPLAIPAARNNLRRTQLWHNVTWMLLAFSLYFWATGGIILWRASVIR